MKMEPVWSKYDEKTGTWKYLKDVDSEEFQRLEARSREHTLQVKMLAVMLDLNWSVEQVVSHYRRKCPLYSGECLKDLMTSGRTEEALKLLTGHRDRMWSC